MAETQKVELRNLITCGIKTGVISFRKCEATGATVAAIADKVFHLANCEMEGKTISDVEVRLLNDPTYRMLVTDRLEHDIKYIPDGNETKDAVIEALEKAYIKPDWTLHLCVGFYENGQFKTNTVKGENLADNIEYNRHMRPGRYYYVDGEYVCGGMLKKEFMPQRIAEHKARIKELDLKPANHDTAPYQ